MKAVWIAMALALCITAVHAAGITSSVEARDAFFEGQSTATGQLLVLLQEPRGDLHAASDFVLTAKNLHVEADWTDLGLSTGVAGHSTEPRSDSDDFSNATVRGLAKRDGYLFQLFPTHATQIVLSGSCATIAPANVDSVERDPRVNNRRDSWRTDTSRGLAWSSCNSTSVDITGDFQLRLWEWDAHLDADEGSQLLHSGRGPLAEGVPAERAYSASEQYLYATNASLHIPSLQGAYQVYLADASVQASEATFRQATLQLPKRVEGEEVKVEGDLDLRLQRDGDGLSGTLAGAAQANGQAVAADSTGFTPWAWLLAAGAAVLVAATAWRLKPRRKPLSPRLAALSSAIDVQLAAYRGAKDAKSRGQAAWNLAGLYNKAGEPVPAVAWLREAFQNDPGKSILCGKRRC